MEVQQGGSPSEHVRFCHPVILTSAPQGARPAAKWGGPPREPPVTSCRLHVYKPSLKTCKVQMDNTRSHACDLANAAAPGHRLFCSMTPVQKRQWWKSKTIGAFGLSMS